MRRLTTGLFAVALLIFVISSPGLVLSADLGAEPDEGQAVNAAFLPLVMYSPQPNRSPNVPASPSPEDGATGQDTELRLSWSGGDLDGDSVTYDVYLEAGDSSPDSLVCNDTTSTTCNPGTLADDTRHSWRVVATDEHGATTAGPVWDFVTAATAPAPDFATQVVNLTNAERADHGCPRLTISPQLTQAAEGHSQDMALNDFFSHTGSDGSSPWDRIKATGYAYSRAAENIAAGYSTPAAVVEGWMNSSGHRANILNCDLTEIGVGYYYLGNDSGDINYRHYWTQNFATPR